MAFKNGTIPQGFGSLCFSRVIEKTGRFFGSILLQIEYQNDLKHVPILVPRPPQVIHNQALHRFLAAIDKKCLTILMPFSLVD
jgi:hypothetical protein